MNRVICWMKKQNISENAAILDIGTGNGVFLVELVCHNIPVQDYLEKYLFFFCITKMLLCIFLRPSMVL